MKYFEFLCSFKKHREELILIAANTVISAGTL